MIGGLVGEDWVDIPVFLLWVGSVEGALAVQIA